MGSLIGLALIAKDEQENLPKLLDSIRGSFDRVVLLDTGSTDDTIRVFQKWAATAGNTGTFSVGHFEWSDDFSLARISADNLLCYGTTDEEEASTARTSGKSQVSWKVWADCDDVIVNAAKLRDLATDAPDYVSAFMFGYDYARPENGPCCCHLVRERLVRVSTAGPWIGRVHEAQPPTGPIVSVPDSVCHWRHEKTFDETAGQSNTRNLAILKQWAQDEPENPRVVGYYGTELAVSGDHQQAVTFFHRYLALPTGWTQERAQICRKLSASYMAMNEPVAARDAAIQGLAVLPDWPETYLTLAEVAIAQGQHAEAIKHARRVLELGAPDTMLIVNPLDFAIMPYRLLALAHAQAGEWDESKAACEAFLKHARDGIVEQTYQHVSLEVKRHHTVQTYVMAAQQLIAHDEQLKALTLLNDCVPHFATDAPEIVQLRADVRQRLSWIGKPAAYDDHYENGGSKPEDFHGDGKIVELCQHLPRVGFLLAGLREQAAA